MGKSCPEGAYYGECSICGSFYGNMMDFINKYGNYSIVQEGVLCTSCYSSKLSELEEKYKKLIQSKIETCHASFEGKKDSNLE